ncbi:hypothetical protein [Streptomyces sp. NPDC088789]|uniref:hypothetical protein n=1 Tax=Streptomyces sp. NPDC088789 TaxID=3365899 RepID=UPI00380A03D4
MPGRPPQLRPVPKPQPRTDIPTSAVAPFVLPSLRPAAVAPAPEPDIVDDGQELVLEDLTREQVRDWRV